MKKDLEGRRTVNPTTFFHFHPTQLVLRRTKTIGKLYPKVEGPYRVTEVSGRYGQQVTIELVEGETDRRPLVVHASQLTPYMKPYVEPNVLDWGVAEEDHQEQRQ